MTQAAEKAPASVSLRRVDAVRVGIDRAIEVCWLLALAIVPLAFNGRDVVVLFLQPKDFALHLFALLIAALWGFDLALGGVRAAGEFGSWRGITRWLGRDPRRWALFGAAAFGLSAAVSTALSPVPEVSLWGRDFAQSGYELYSVLSLLVVFFAIGLRIRTGEQVRRVLWVVAAAGGVTGAYGVSQHFGWDPIGNGAGQARVVSSFGNPIFFGSYLVMSTVVTAGLAFEERGRGGRWRIPAISVLAGVQLAAMWFTGSRGPWLGLAFGLLALAALGWYGLGRARAQRAGLALLGGFAITVALIVLPGDTEGEARGLGSIVEGVNPTAGGFGGRTGIWQGSIRLLDSWEVQGDESALRSAARPVFGLGPEMYYYSYPLVANPQTGVIVPTHAHDLPLHLLLELGLAGLLSFLSLAALVFIAGMTFIRANRGREAWLAVAMVAVMAALTGRGAEQVTGVARIGDLAPFWALMGLALAIHRIGVDDRPARARSAPERAWTAPYLSLGVTSAFAVVLLALFITRDVQMLRSGLIVADAFEESAAGNRAEAVRLLKRGADISPDVRQYHVWTGELLLEDARREADAGAALKLLGEAYNAFVVYEERDPLDFTTRLRVGLVEAELVNRGDGFRLTDLVQRSGSTADAMPAYPRIQAFAAERVLIAGQLELGLELANRAIAMEQSTAPQPLAWFMRGNALGDMGDFDGALASFEAALERGPDGQFAPGIHRSMALVYEAIGDASEASLHRNLAREIEAQQNEGAP